MKALISLAFSLFLPSGGYYNGKTYWNGTGHYFLGSQCISGGEEHAYGITFWNGMCMYDMSNLRYWGLNIRPVHK